MKILVMTKDDRTNGIYLIQANDQDIAWLNMLLCNFKKMPGWKALYVTLNQFLKRVKAERFEHGSVEPDSVDKIYIF